MLFLTIVISLYLSVESLLSHISYKRFGLTVTDHFGTQSPPPSAAADYYIQCADNPLGRLSEFHTLLIDLAQPESEIWHNIYHRTRIEISSFIRNQEHEHFIGNNLPKNELNHYIRCFNRFAKYKKIRKAEVERLRAYNRYGILYISGIKFNNELLVINFYRVNHARASNINSFTLGHELPSINQSMFGRAHKALHWLDIIEFRRKEVQYYDLCGWYSGSENKTLLNINRFKEQFSSNRVLEYSGVIYSHPILKLMGKLKGNG